MASADKTLIDGLGVGLGRFRQYDGNAERQFARHLLGVQGPDFMRMVSPVRFQAGYASAVQRLLRSSLLLGGTSLCLPFAQEGTPFGRPPFPVYSVDGDPVPSPAGLVG